MSDRLAGLLDINSQLFIPVETQCRIAKHTLSGLKHLRIIIFLSKSSHLVSHSPGSCASSGIGLSELNQWCHSLEFRLTAAGRPEKVSGNNLSSSVMLSQAVSVIQSIGGFGGQPFLSRTVPPRRKKSYSKGLIFPSTIWSLTNIQSDSSSLCLSNRERQAAL